ncbi:MULTISPECIES: hypothetical protein [unclassified Streptomyces]|uniref:hypothetical protein n=1 Tax=unclassified Streptomyces TaxID=2593676 RepID=UPI002365FE02|nr:MULTISPECIES: hypothetical protein [unclassified Streptomyces]MDF3140344.1 hypothetical protein [Streptomyces sp. T21Q-yed]WDF39385.1 hypothetical protein PBV52_22545 [Streptomyces sp. T12]
MAQLELEVLTDDASEAAAFEAYWRLNEDGETWAQTVTAIRTEYGLKPQQMTRIAQQAGTAYLADLLCESCEDPYPVSSRSDLAQALRFESWKCPSCHEREVEEQAARVKEQKARRRAEVYEQYPVMNGPDLEPADLTLFEAIALHTLFSDPAVEDAGLTSPTDIWPKERRWAPEQLRYDFERGLLKAVPRLIKVHPDSHLDAFALDDDGELSDSFYLGRVSYYLMGQADELTDRHPRLLQALNRTFREGPWPTSWAGQWRELWDELVLADAQDYLAMKLGEHHLEMNQGEGTRTALQDALSTFSLGQVFNFIYRAAKDSAAYYQRGGVNKRQAANSTIGRISASADRARANGWDVKPFGRPWNLPLSAIGETFFSKVMWQPDMMQVASRDAQVPLHAWPAENAAEGTEDEGSEEVPHPVPGIDEEGTWIDLGKTPGATPWPDVNDLLKLEPGTVTAIVSVPTAGRSTMALNIALHNATADRLTVFSTCEINSDAIERKLVSATCGADLRYPADTVDFDSLRRRASESSVRVPGWHTPAIGLPLEQVFREAATTVIPPQRGRLALWVVDTIQSYSDLDEEGLALSMDVARRIAEEHNLAVLITARALSEGPDEPLELRHVPTPIARGADTIVELHRDGVYWTNLPDADSAIVRALKVGGKQCKESVSLKFEAPFCRFVRTDR